VLVADVDVYQLAAEVEIALAGVVPQLSALCPGDHQRVEAALRRPRMEHILAVQLAYVLIADGGSVVK